MRSDQVLVMDMLLSAQAIIEFTHGISEQEFTASRLLQSAILREIQVIGEAARQVSDEGKTRYAKVAWHKIAGMRNRVIHEYFEVRLDVVWDVVTVEIPSLIETLRGYLPDSGDDDEGTITSF